MRCTQRLSACARICVLKAKHSQEYPGMLQRKHLYKGRAACPNFAHGRLRLRVRRRTAYSHIHKSKHNLYKTQPVFRMVIYNVMVRRRASACPSCRWTLQHRLHEALSRRVTSRSWHQAAASASSAETSPTSPRAPPCASCCAIGRSDCSCCRANPTADCWHANRADPAPSRCSR